FGIAQEPMRQFYELLDPQSGRMMHHQTYAKMIALLDEATNAAGGDKAVLARIDQLKLFMVGDYIQNRFYCLDPNDIEPRKPWALRLSTHSYRTRYDWINHYGGVAHSANGLSKKYEEPSWSPRNKDAIPWKVEEPIGPAELAKLWQEVKAYFGPAPTENET